MDRRLTRAALLAVLAGAGCAKLIGLPDYTAGAGTGGAGGTTTTTSTSGTTTSTTTDGGTGGSEAGTGPCVEGATCYDGLDGTEGVGPCKVGTCKGGVCTGEVVPQLKSCGADAGNDNCDVFPKCDGHVRAFHLSTVLAGDTVSPTGPPFDVLGGVAAAPDGTFAITAHPQNPGAAIVNRFDAWGRACAAIVAPTGTGTALPHGVAVSGGRATGQVRCDGNGTASVAAETIVAGETTSAVDFGNGCPAPATPDQAFVVRYDAAGHCKKAAFFTSGGGAKAAATDALVGTANGQEVVVVAGTAANGFAPSQCTGTLDGSPGPKVFVMELSGDLQTCLWATSFPANILTLHGPRLAAVPTSVSLPDAGSFGDLLEVILAGTYTGTLTLGGKMFTADQDAGAPAAGAFAVKVSLATKTVTDQAFALDGAGHRLNGLAVGPGGNVYLAGSLDAAGTSTCAGEENLGSTGYVYVLDPMLGGVTGHLCFPTNLPTSWSSVYGVAVDPAANVSFAVAHGAPLTGAYASPAGLTIGKARSSALGTPLWAQTASSVGVLPFGVAVDGMGDVLVGGTASCSPACTVAVGDHALAVPAKAALFALQLAP